MDPAGLDPRGLLQEAAVELDAAAGLPRRAPADPAVIERCARSVVLALRAVLADRGSVVWAQADPAAFPALLGEAGFRPPAAVTRLIGSDAAAVDCDEALTSAHAALAWSSASLTAVSAERRS